MVVRLKDCANWNNGVGMGGGRRRVEVLKGEGEGGFDCPRLWCIVHLSAVTLEHGSTAQSKVGNSIKTQAQRERTGLLHAAQHLANLELH